MSYSHFMTKSAPWRTLHSDYVIATPFLRLRRDRIELPDGTIIEDYYVRESRGFTIVFAMTSDDRVVLVHQYKHGIGEYVLELPAGAIDPDEDPLTCAARELAEETGYVSDRPLELVRTFITDPTNSDGRFHLYLARDCEVRVAQAFDATEDIRVELVTLPELRAMVRDGRINVNSHVASVYTVLEFLTENQ
jgi:ADP-ribose pyrophosphatase